LVEQLICNLMLFELWLNNLP